MGHQINWDKIVLYVLATIAFIYLVGVLKDLKPANNTTIPIDTTKIDNLKKEKDSLVTELTKLQEDFNELLKKRIDNINTRNNEQVLQISNISTYNDSQRDSLWTILFSSKDSLPTRYWDLLEQRTRTKSP